MSLFLLGTSCLARKASLSEEKPLPFWQRVRRPRKNGLRLIAIFSMARTIWRTKRDRDREIQRMEREESRSNWILTKVALGKFIDQMTWLCI